MSVATNDAHDKPTYEATDRISITAPEFAAQLFTTILPHLPTEGFLRPASVRRRNDAAGRAPHSLNTNIRLYKYTAGQYFGAHYDDSVRDTVTGSKSEWTLLIYLSGVQDGVEGGEVRLLCNVSRCGSQLRLSADTLLQR